MSSKIVHAASLVLSCLLGAAFVIPSVAHAESTTVSGWVSSAAVNGHVADLQGVKVLVMDPGTTPATTLATASLDTANPNCLPIACPFSISGVDLSKTKVGLGIWVGGEGKDSPWVSAFTGTASQAHIAAARKAHRPLGDQFAFAVNQQGLNTLGKLAGRPPADLLASGAFVGVALGRLSEKNPATGFPPTIRGATVSAPMGVQIVYPNKRYTAVEPAMSEAGAFIALPTAAHQAINAWQIKGPAGDSHTWAPINAAITAGTILLVLFPAQG